MRVEIIEMAKSNIGSLCSFLKNKKNILYLEEVINNIPTGLIDISMSEKIAYYVYDKSVGDRCDCGNPKKFIGFKNGWRETCGLRKCVVESRKNTCLYKYGVDNPKKSKEILKRESDNIKIKWGGDHYMKSSDVQSKFKKTMISRYGVEWAQQSQEISGKSLVTWVNNPEREGIVNKRSIKLKEVFKNNYESINDKKDKTIIENWGSKQELYEHINNKIRESSLEKFGVDHHLSHPDIIDKRVQSYKDNITNKIIEKLPTSIEYLSREGNDNNTDSKINIRCQECTEVSKITRQYLGFRIEHGKTPCLTCLPILSGKSNFEIELLNYIKEIYFGEIVSNTKSIIDGELDIYLPSLNLAFEFNGLYWHSELYKDKKYHLNKSKQCEDVGVNLIHVWEDDWIYRQDIIKSIVSNKLSKSDRIYARKCEVVIITDNKLVKNFLNENHLQGFVGSKVKIGLFYDDELVSLMTFGSLRKSLNSKSVNGTWELIRFCNKSGFTVVGGSSRLLKKFITTENPIEIISYSDSSRSGGDMYKKLDFKKEHHTEPNYYWIVDGLRNHRFNFRKDKLVSQGYDINKTETEIMHGRGYYRLFDCGSIKWKLLVNKAV